MKRILAAVVISAAVTVSGGVAADAATVRVPGCASKRCDDAPKHRFPIWRGGPINTTPHRIGFGF